VYETWLQPENKTDKMVEVVQLFYDQPFENVQVIKTPANL